MDVESQAGRHHENPLRRRRKKDRNCRRRKRADGCPGAGGRGKAQAGRRSAVGGAATRRCPWPSRGRRKGDPAIRRSGDPAIRRSGDPAIRRSGDPAIRRSGDPAIRRSGDPAIRRSGDPAIRRSGDPAIRRSGDPAIILRGASSGIVNPRAEQFSVRPPSGPNIAARAAPMARTAVRPSLNPVIASPPNLWPGRHAQDAPLPSIACFLPETLCRSRREFKTQTHPGQAATPSPAPAAAEPKPRRIAETAEPPCS